MSLVLSIDKANYLYEPFLQAFAKHLPQVPVSDKPDFADAPIFHYADYEDYDFDNVLSNKQYHISTYVYRKALIRKHFLAHTIHMFVAKNPHSILKTGFPETYQIEVDYAEFLDDALDECYELRDEVNKGDRTWILKPGMSDKGQGIRIFKTLDQLQEIFDSFEEDEDSDEENENEDAAQNGVITSQLRHFVVQEYMENPLLVNSRKFHLRCYVVASGALKVYVYNRILALFAHDTYDKKKLDDLEQSFASLNLDEHLTNTCLQSDASNSVFEFGELSGISKAHKESILQQIHELVSQLFKAAVNVDRINFQPMENAMEFYGLDFLVNDKMQVTLLEVNAYPDFKQTGGDLKQLVYGLIDETVKEVVKPIFADSPQNSSESSVSLKSSTLLTKVLDQQL